jgi:hypothetical protein
MGNALAIFLTVSQKTLAVYSFAAKVMRWLVRTPGSNTPFLVHYPFQHTASVSLALNFITHTMQIGTSLSRTNMRAFTTFNVKLYPSEEGNEGTFKGRMGKSPMNFEEDEIRILISLKTRAVYL